MIDQQLLKAVTSIVNEVGNYQLDCFRSIPPGGGEEKIAREFVSEVDLKSEQMLIEGLQKLVPEAGFFGEETGTSGATKIRWIIDPLDGTTNYLSGLEQFSISVALEIDEAIHLGVVLRPASRETFSARRGNGLFLNEHRCQPVQQLPLKNALIGTGFPYRSKDLAKMFFSCAEEVLFASRGLRRFGSAALDLCYVAGGFLQGFWETDLQPYDVAAALLFLEETGCVTTNQLGKPFSTYTDRLLITAPAEVHSELLKIVANHYKN